MKRIFGTSKQQAAGPTLDEATQKMDTRVVGLDEKIRRLDNELVGYKEKLKTTRPGGARNAIQQRARRALKQKKMYNNDL